MKKAITLFSLLGLFIWGVAQPPNAGFESWPAPLSPSPFDTILTNYGAINPLQGTPTHWSTDGSDIGVCRVGDAFEGDYASLVHVYYYYGRSQLSQTQFPPYRVNGLGGEYRYLVTDTSYGKAWARANFYGFYAGDTVGFGTYEFDTSSTWKHFNFTINWTQFVVPDSVRFEFISATDQTLPNNVDGLLFLDDIEWLIVLNQDAPRKDFFHPYPNPATGELRFDPLQESGEVRIYDLQGKRLLKAALPAGSSEISVADLPRGAAIIEFSGKNGGFHRSKLILE